jgi:hypothetical protein
MADPMAAGSSTSIASSSSSGSGRKAGNRLGAVKNINSSPVLDS